MPPKRRKLLSYTRPRPVHATTSKRLSSPQTRYLIRTHHTLQKNLSAAVAAGDTEQVLSLQTQIAAQGGLALYQRASLQGQSAERGGDSGVVLRRWVEEWMRGKRKRGAAGKVRMLEVGALRIDNACSRSSVFAVERIDLRSQHPSIEQQDFIGRPLPATAADQFDIVSLSLVLNYVGTPAARGEMLQRVEKFLRPALDVLEHEDSGGGEDRGLGEEVEVGEGLVPGLFLVLPAPCVTNSRYLDEQRLESIMRGLGYVKARRKMSAKLVYYFWRFVGVGEGGIGEGGLERTGTSGFRKAFKKEELRPGRKRNNFAIVLA